MVSHGCARSVFVLQYIIDPGPFGMRVYNGGEFPYVLPSYSVVRKRLFLTVRIYFFVTVNVVKRFFYTFLSSDFF